MNPETASRKAISKLRFQILAALLRWPILWGAASCLVLASGCAQQMSQEPKFKPLEPSAFFKNNSSARPLVAGTVTRVDDKEAAPLMLKSGGAYVDAFPFPVTREIMERGRKLYNIHCAVCHGYTGDGDGMIVRRGFSSPPSFHRDDVRAQAAGFYFDVITNGYGAMGRYGYQVGEQQDRWAIIAYIRALQLSRHANLGDVTPEQRSQLSEGAGGQRQ